MIPCDLFIIGAIVIVLGVVYYAIRNNDLNRKIIKALQDEVTLLKDDLISLEDARDSLKRGMDEEREALIHLKGSSIIFTDEERTVREVVAIKKFIQDRKTKIEDGFAYLVADVEYEIGDKMPKSI